MFIKKCSDFEFQLCCALFVSAIDGAIVDCRFSSKRCNLQRKARSANNKCQHHARQHRPARPPANAMATRNGNAFAGATAAGRAVRRSLRRTTPASGAATDASRSRPGMRQPVEDPLPLPCQRGGFSARRALVLATAARRWLRGRDHSQLLKGNFY